MTKEQMNEFTESLLSWYQKKKRDLPWRKTKDAYCIWISEIMLQQTRVEAVIPYYERFLKEFPTLKDLAFAAEDKVLKQWEGLGYYSRARNLQKCAKQLIEEGKSTLPEEEQELKMLPGIGDYTAAAIAAIAYHRKTPAIDGNVLRVMTRIMKDSSDISKEGTKRKYKEKLKEHMGSDPSAFTQALMELGAMVCLPHGMPLCEQCPLSFLCQSYRDKSMLEYPTKRKKKERRIEKKTVFLFQVEQKIQLKKRPAKGLLASLYEYPNVDGYLVESDVRDYCQKRNYQIRKIKKLPHAIHVFSHIEWHMIGYFIELESMPKTNKEQWVRKEDLFDAYSVPSAFKKYSDYLKEK